MRRKLLIILAAGCVAASLARGANVIVTFAGNGTQDFGGDGAAATGAELSSPSGLAMDAAGNLYIADKGNNRVRMVSAATGNISTVAGNGTQGYTGDGGAAINAELASPSGVAVDADGNIYIADTFNQRIRLVYANTGNIITFAGNGTSGYSGDGGSATNAELSNPAAVALDSNGNLLIADKDNNVIREVDAASDIIITVAGNGAAGYGGDGAAATSGLLDGPSGITVAASGILFIADRFNNRVRAVTDGIIQTAVGTGVQGFSGDGLAAANAELSNPFGVALDGSGNLYIADNLNQRIRLVSVPSGIITTAAGDGTANYSGDGGDPVYATLNSPAAVLLDGSGNLYIADSGNQRVRKVTFSPANTVAVPIFSTPGGVFTSTQTVTISSATTNASIYYTTDGSTPTTASNQYSGPIAISENTVLNAIGVAGGLSNSTVATAVFVVNIINSVATPTFSPPGGSYSGAQSVTISCATTGAAIFYTTDGTTPTTASAIFSTPISVSKTTTITAYAVLSGLNNSPVSSATYTLILPIPGAPTSEVLHFTDPFLVKNTDPTFAEAGDPSEPQFGGSAGGNVADPAGFDLGDVPTGAPFTRYISASGGFKPYSYEVVPVANDIFTPQGAAISSAGVLTGIAPAAPGRLHYAITLTDFFGTIRTGWFKINVLPSTPAAPQFAQSQLPAGILGRSYYTSIVVVGGTPPYDISAGSITASDGSNPSLDELGLCLGPDGILTGCPLETGASLTTLTSLFPISLTIHATDVNGTVALSRTSSSPDQTFVLAAAASSSSQTQGQSSLSVFCTELTSFQCQLSSHVFLKNMDGFSYTGLLDSKGDIAPNLAGTPFVLRVGSAAFTGTFDDAGHGNLISGPGALQLKFNAGTGQLSLKIAGADLGGGNGTQTYPNKSQNLVVALEAGTLRTCEVLSMSVTRRGNYFFLNYKAGTVGASPVGGFQIIAVQGSDGASTTTSTGTSSKKKKKVVTTTTGDRWAIRFLGMPPGLASTDAAKNISSSAMATVNIGDNFTQNVTVTLQQVQLQFRATPASPADATGIWLLNLNPQTFIHQLNTYLIESTGTDGSGIPTAASLGSAYSGSLKLFALGVSLDAFNGLNGRVIMPSGSKWLRR